MVKSCAQVKRKRPATKAPKPHKPVIKWIHPAHAMRMDMQALMRAGIEHKQALAVALERKNIRAQHVPVSPASDAFLASYEWRRARMQALKTHGPRCQCCGATPATGATINVDHIKPRRLFPHLALEQSNLQILCQECNHGKGNWDMTDWRSSQLTSE